MMSHSFSHGGDISDEVRSNSQLDSSRDLHGNLFPPRSAASGASSEREVPHSRQQSLEDMEEGGAEKHGHKMSSLRPPRVHYGAVEGDIHFMGPAPGDDVVRGDRDRPEVRRGDGNVFRGRLHDDQIPLVHEGNQQREGLVRGDRDRSEERRGGGNVFRGRLRDDEIPLVQEDGGNQQRGGLKACCKKYRNFTCLCTVGVSLVLVAFAFISVPSVIHVREMNREYYMYTTANESNSVYAESEVVLMESVCMVEDRADMEWVLHTGSCSSAPVMHRDFPITGNASTTTGYYFYFVAGSSVQVSMNPNNGRAHYLFSTNARKATDMDRLCGSSEGSDIPISVFDRTGYYFICIIPNEDLSFTINIHEHYYNRPITNECNNTEYHGSEKHRCCKISNIHKHHCVYLTTRNRRPEHMERPHRVKVHLKYSHVLTPLMGVLIPALFVIGVLLIGLAIWKWKKRGD